MKIHTRYALAFVLAIAGFLLPGNSSAQVVIEYRTDQPPIPNNTIYGIAPGVMAFSGDVEGASNSLNIEAFTRVPLSDLEDAAFYCALGYSKIEGHNYDANTPPRTLTARNPFTYLLFMPSYRINTYKRVAIWVKAGFGGGYLRSQNPETEGAKLFIPVGVDFNYHFSGQWMFTTNLSYMFCGSDLDGIKRGANPDYRENDNLINLVMGIAYTP